MQNENTTNSSQIQAGIQGNNSENQNANQNSPLNSSEFSSQNGGISPQNTQNSGEIQNTQNAQNLQNLGGDFKADINGDSVNSGGISPQNTDIDNDTDSDNAENDSENENSPESDSDTKLSWDEFRQSDEFKKIRTYEKDGRIIYKPLTRQIRKLVSYNEVSLKDVDTSDVKNMKWTFKYSTRTGSQWDGIEDWDVSRVKGFEGTFYGCTEFNADLTHWNVRNARTFQDMFYQCHEFDRPIGARWQTDSVTNTIGMFRTAKKFNNGGQPFGEGWKMDNVCWTWEMFWGAENFNQPVNHWKMDNVIKCVSMFRKAKAFNQPLDQWRMPKCPAFSHMFSGAESFNQDLSAWGEWIGNAKSMTKMFFKARSLTINFLDAWNIADDCNTTKMLDYSGLQSGKSNLTQITQTLSAKDKKFVVSQIDIDEKDDLMSYLKRENFIKEPLKKLNDNSKFLGENFLSKNIEEQYKIYLAKLDESNEEGDSLKMKNADERSWDFAFFELFGNYFLIEKGDDSEQIKKENSIRIYQEADESNFEDFDSDDTGAIYEGASLKIYFESGEIYIVNSDNNNSLVLKTINSIVLAKAYNVRMRELDREARIRDVEKIDSGFLWWLKDFLRWLKNSTIKTIKATFRLKKDEEESLEKCHRDLCKFDLHSYRAVPIVPNAEDVKFLVGVWKEISAFYMVGETHDELKDTIAQVAKLVSDEKAKNMSRRISILAILVSLFVGIFAPPIREWILNWQIWKTIFGG